MPFVVCVIKSSGTVEMQKMSRADAEREAKYQRTQGCIVEIIESAKLVTKPAKTTIPAWIAGG
jgi:hypothetical protein